MEKEGMNYINATNQALDCLLAKYSYSAKLRNEDYGDFHFSSWERDYPWKIHEIELIWKPPETNRLDIKFEVYIRSSKQDEQKSQNNLDGAMDLDGAMVSDLAGRGSYYLFPTLFRNLRLNRFVKRVITDTERALPWFNQFETPKQAIETFFVETRNGSRSNKLLDQMRLHAATEAEPPPPHP